MAGIYLHIPFCKQACNYCNFHFTTSLRYKNELVEAIGKEILLQKNFLANEKINTIYFGGGTPSLLSIDECHFIIERLKNEFDVAPNAEITLEANPDDVELEKLHAWKNLGINRLSIGIQSFFEEDLRWMNRAHNANQAHKAIEWSQQAGFNNMSIDLIYGTPLLSDEMWQKNVETAFHYNIPHLSCYALTVEEKTPLHKQISTQKKQAVDADKQASQFLLLMQWASEKGYEHYEVSNFAKPGLRSRHNSSYWRGEKYLGLGPSAHSYDGSVRKWNVANNQKYISSVNAGIVDAETEELSSFQKLNEYIMISLRTMEGLDIDHIAKCWDESKALNIEKELKVYLNSGLVKKEDNYIKLTNEGMLMADGIAAHLFFTEH